MVLDGIPGHPAAEARKKAALNTFAKYPGIKVVWSGYGEWDEAKAQAVMATVIAVLLTIFPLWRGGQCYGSLLLTRDKPFTAEERAYLELIAAPLHASLSAPVIERLNRHPHDQG